MVCEVRYPDYKSHVAISDRKAIIGHAPRVDLNSPAAH